MIYSQVFYDRCAARWGITANRRVAKDAHTLPNLTVEAALVSVAPAEACPLSIKAAAAWESGLEAMPPAVALEPRMFSKSETGGGCSSVSRPDPGFGWPAFSGSLPAPSSVSFSMPKGPMTCFTNSGSKLAKSPPPATSLGALSTGRDSSSLSSAVSSSTTGTPGASSIFTSATGASSSSSSSSTCCATSSFSTTGTTGDSTIVSSSTVST
mmetsp:Transcript_40363/g.114266  ORF Transcript_40363/g.114266 Transcript_40363/m.114266 type:complete len:211 (+) Transcript_40363:262-894(+)